MIKFYTTRPRVYWVWGSLLILGIAALLWWTAPTEQAHLVDSQHETPQLSIAERSHIPHTTEPTPAHGGNLPRINEQAAASGLLRAQQLLERGEPLAAAELLKDLLKEFPANTELMMELAMIELLDLKNPQQAQTLLERAIQIKPDLRAALNELISLYEDPAHTEQGVEFLLGEAAKTSDNVELNYAVAKLLAHTGEATESLGYFDLALNGIHDIRDQVHIDAAEAAASAQQYERAWKGFSEAVRLQEEEKTRSKDFGNETQALVEDRIFATKMAWARTLLHAGKTAEARILLNDLSGRGEQDPEWLALHEQLSRSDSMTKQF